MAWALRRFPVFSVFGRGDYRVQPIYVGDLANQAVSAGSRSDSFVADAVGTETFTYEELLRLPAEAVGDRAWLMPTPSPMGFAITKLVGFLLRNIVLTRDEVDGLMAELLTSRAPPTGTAKLGDCLTESRDTLGSSYVSELSRDFRQRLGHGKGYSQLRYSKLYTSTHNAVASAPQITYGSARSFSGVKYSVTLLESSVIPTPD